jgi:hypothetical protein
VDFMTPNLAAKDFVCKAVITIVRSFHKIREFRPARFVGEQESDAGKVYSNEVINP